MVSQYRPQIIVITESWLNENIDSNLINIPDYSIFRCDRKNRPGGGVCVWVRIALIPKQIICNHNDNSFDIVTLYLQKCQILVCSIYIPPNLGANKHHDINNFLTETLDSFLITNVDSKLLIAGDFNDFDLTHLLTNFNLENKVLSPTRGNACLDKILISSDLQSYFPNEAQILDPISTSDHSTIFLQSISTYNKTYRNCRIMDLRESNKNAFLLNLSQKDFSPVYRENDIDKKLNIFYDILKDSLSTIPKTTVSMTSRDKPWMSPLLKHLITLRWNAYRARNFNVYNHLKSKIKSEIINSKKCWAAKKLSSSKSVWNLINDIKGVENTSIESLLPERLEDRLRVVNNINNSFISNFITDPINIPINNTMTDDWLPLTDSNYICRYLNKINSKKATGSDGIPSIIFKISSDIIMNPLCNIINSSILQCYVPHSWKLATVSPIPKTKPININQLRPISLLPLPSKILERIVLDSIKNKIFTHLDNNQFAYKKNSSTTCALIRLHEIVTRLMESSNCIGVAILALDYSKAFDTISHRILIQQLLDLQFPTKFINWLKSYLTNRKQKIKVNDIISSEETVKSGVPQGSILGPYLFILYINSLKSEYCIKYADDTTIILPIYTDVGESNNSLNRSYDEIKKKSVELGLRLNEEKSKLLIIKKKPFDSEQVYVPGVSKVKKLKLLGLHFEENLNWSTHINSVITRCSKQSYAFRLMRPLLTPQQMTIAFSGLVQPIIYYAAPVWIALPNNLVNKLSKLCKRFHKIIHGYNCDCTQITDVKTKLFDIAKKLFLQAKSNPNHPLFDLIPLTNRRNNHYHMEYSGTKRRQSTFHIQMALYFNNNL